MSLASARLRSCRTIPRLTLRNSFNNMKAFAAIRAAFQGQALRALMGSISKSGAMSGGLLEVNRNKPS